MDPSLYECGNGALVVRSDAFRSYLDRESLSLIWIVGGEKMIFTPGSHAENYQGRLDIAGLYALKESGAEGSLWSNFEFP